MLHRSQRAVFEINTHMQDVCTVIPPLLLHIHDTLFTGLVRKAQDGVVEALPVCVWPDRPRAENNSSASGRRKGDSLDGKWTVEWLNGSTILHGASLVVTNGTFRVMDTDYVLAYDTTQHIPDNDTAQHIPDNDATQPIADKDATQHTPANDATQHIPPNDAIQDMLLNHAASEHASEHASKHTNMHASEQFTLTHRNVSFEWPDGTVQQVATDEGSLLSWTTSLTDVPRIIWRRGWSGSKEGGREEDEKSECAVCCEALSERCTWLPCSHAFHESCIAKWLQGASTCPTLLSLSFPRPLPRPLSLLLSFSPSSHMHTPGASTCPTCRHALPSQHHDPSEQARASDPPAPANSAASTAPVATTTTVSSELPDVLTPSTTTTATPTATASANSPLAPLHHNTADGRAAAAADTAVEGGDGYAGMRGHVHQFVEVQRVEGQVYIYINKYTYIYIFTHTHEYIYTNIHLHTNTHVCIYLYIYICI